MIEINNLSGASLEKKIFSTVAKKVLKGENREIPTKSRTRDKIGAQTLSLAFVSKAEIKKLNKKFRKKDKATDVLSFELEESLSAVKYQKGYLGEIVICPEVVKEKGEDILKVFVHGILHLLGYDHEKSEKDAETMEKKENYYLSI